MSNHHKLSLSAAVLINLNIMVGFGIFVNTVLLSKMVGFLGFTSYILVAALVFPLILCVSELVRRYPLGNFYTYASQNIHPLAGFISSWGYFIAKLASASFIIHASVKLAQSVIPAMFAINAFWWEFAILLAFTFLNTLHMNVGSKVAYFFIILKLTPLIFGMLISAYLLTAGTSLTATPLLWEGMPVSIPFVLYAFTGFEATCSISQHIIDSHRNGPRAIMISYILAVLLNVIYQFLFFGAVGSLLIQKTDYLGAFPSLYTALFPHNTALIAHVTAITHLAIAAAALGGSYGILFSNHWNLHMLAQHGHTFFTKTLTHLNAYGIPVAGVLVELLICVGYLAITRGNQGALQQINSLGATIGYTLSIVSLWIARKKEAQSIALPLFGFGSCMILIGTSVRNLLQANTTSFIAFSAILAIGIGMYALTHFKRHQRNQTQHE